MVYNWLKTNLFPAHFTDCRLCSLPTNDASGLCHGCLADLPWNHHACPRCGAGLANFVATACGECLRHPPQFDSSHIPFRYAPPLIPFITGLKFHARLAEARFLAELFLCGSPANALPLPECLIPVPLHAKRLRERGYNQALELARPLGRALDIPVDNHLCSRVRPTAAQSLLGNTARRVNMRNAFAVNSATVTPHVAIVDDVMTTGCTADELARALKRAGVSLVEVWVVARAV